VVAIEPIPHVNRQQEALLAIAIEEVVAHVQPFR
jgi:hypothetical protein